MTSAPCQSLTNFLPDLSIRQTYVHPLNACAPIITSILSSISITICDENNTHIT